MNTDVYKKLIQSKKWTRLRFKKLSNNPLCEKCLHSDIVTPAAEIHHIKPIESVSDAAVMYALAYDYNNLISLCHKCHVSIHISLKSKSKQANKTRVKNDIDRFISTFLESDKDIYM